jgi:hypothetical protein
MSTTVDLNVKSTHYTEALPLAPLTIEPLTVKPVAVHLKELNQVAPLTVDSLRVDQVRHVDPLRIDQLNITNLPTVSLSMSQLPALDINLRSAPPLAVAIQQQFEMSSDYAMTARVLGLPLVSLSLKGRTTITPKDCARREQSRTHEHSFTDVAALGNPAIPSRAIETCVETVGRCAPSGPPPPRRRQGMHAGAPRFGVSLQQQPAPARAPARDSGVGG